MVSVSKPEAPNKENLTASSEQSLRALRRKENEKWSECCLMCVLQSTCLNTVSKYTSQPPKLLRRKRDEGVSKKTGKKGEDREDDKENKKSKREERRKIRREQ
jgi:hypothetical protein